VLAAFFVLGEGADGGVFAAPLDDSATGIGERDQVVHGATSTNCTLPPSLTMATTSRPAGLGARGAIGTTI
jgi:hypothetical protein